MTKYNTPTTSHPHQRTHNNGTNTPTHNQPTSGDHDGVGHLENGVEVDQRLDALDLGDHVGQRVRHRGAARVPAGSVGVGVGA